MIFNKRMLFCGIFDLENFVNRSKMLRQLLSLSTVEFQLIDNTLSVME